MGHRKSRQPGDPGRVVGYVRVSTDEQRLGPEAQQEALERWCAARGAELVAVHSDLGASGGADLEKRSGLISAVDALAAHGAGVLLVAKRDRLARDVVISAMVERLTERNGGKVLAADGTGNGTGPEAQLMRTIVDAFAQYERALIGARTRTALAVKKAKGERVGSVPYGYALASDGGRLVPHAGEQEVVTLVRRMRACGASLRAIAESLAHEGHRPRSGGRWHPQTVARIAQAIDGCTTTA